MKKRIVTLLTTALLFELRLLVHGFGRRLCPGYGRGKVPER